MVNCHSARRPRKGLLLLTTLALVAVALSASVSTADAVSCKVKTTEPSAAAPTTPAASVEDFSGEDETIPSAAEEDAEDDATPAPAPASVPSMTTKVPTPTATKDETPAAAAAGNATLPANKGSKCVTGDPTQYISKEYVDWIWEKRMKKEVMANTHFLYNQLMENKGKLRYCIRWDSTNKLPKATASKFKAMLEQQYAQWNKWLIGYGCWPFDKIEVEIVGVAVKTKALLDWTDDSLGPIYENILDPDGKPMCHAGCYRYVDRDLTTEACPGKVFDVSLWPTLGLGGGMGYDWGQQVDEDSVISSLGASTSHIVAHEIGHGFGLLDFYEEKDKPGPNLPKMLMEAGASMFVTEGDGWLLRRGWENVRSRWPETSG